MKKKVLSLLLIPILLIPNYIQANPSDPLNNGSFELELDTYINNWQANNAERLPNSDDAKDGDYLVLLTGLSNVYQLIEYDHDEFDKVTYYVQPSGSINQAQVTITIGYKKTDGTTHELIKDETSTNNDWKLFAVYSTDFPSDTDFLYSIKIENRSSSENTPFWLDLVYFYWSGGGGGGGGPPEFDP